MHNPFVNMEPKIRLGSNVLSGVIQRLVEALDPMSVYLYGSYAYGRPRSDSDIDLLVVVPDNQGSSYQCTVKACKALRGMGLPVEVKVVKRSTFSDRQNWISSVEHDVKQKGLLLYGTAV